MEEINFNNFSYVYENIYSFHTLEFTIMTSLEKIKYVRDFMTKKYAPRRGEGTNKYLYCDWSIGEIGVRVVLQIQKGYLPEGYCNKIKFIVNPRTLLSKKTEYIGIFHNTESNINILIEELNKLPEMIGLKNEDYDFNLFKNVSLTRIDLCTNLMFESENMAEIIFELMKRGNNYFDYKPITYYDKKGKRKKNYENAIYLDGFAERINIYNKGYQMNECNLKDAEVKLENKGIIRFEIQWKRHRIKEKIKAYTHSATLNEFLLVINLLSEKSIRKCVNNMFLQGRYFTLSGAISFFKYLYSVNKIDMFNMNTAVDFLKLVAKKRYLREALTETEDIKSIISLFNKYNVNPVTIPGRWVQKEVVLPSVLEMLRLDNIKRKYEVNEKLRNLKKEIKDDNSFVKEENIFVKDLHILRRIDLEEIMEKFV